MKKEHTKPAMGILDVLDIVVGRISDSDSTLPGLRKRSWGATVMLLCMIPAFTLVGAVAFAVVYSTVKTPITTVSTPATTSTTTNGIKVTKLIKTKPVRVSTPDKLPNYIGWPIVILAGLILCVGVAFALFRREQDLNRALKLGGMAAEIRNGTSGTVSTETNRFLETTLQNVVSKVTGVAPVTTTVGVEDPVIAEPDEWAERRKQQGGSQ